MGLDAVEIIMQVEDVFDISLEDADLVRLSCPRDLIDTIMDKVALTAPSGCLTQCAFDLARAALLKQVPLSRREVVPSARLADLVPRQSRASVMESISAELNVGPLPALQRPQALLQLSALVAIVLGVVTGVALHESVPDLGGFSAFLAGLAVAVLVQASVWVFTFPLCTDFPAIIRTAGDLARWVAARKPDLAGPKHGGWTREQVAGRVREIIVEQLGCAGAYDEDTALRDLGMS